MLALHTPQPDLMNLARDRSREGRLRLVQVLADAYLQPGQDLSPQESEQFSDFINDLFRGTVPPEVRRLLSERASAATCLPQAVVRMLAADSKIEVAGPILKSSPLLNDSDLLEVIGLRLPSHQMAIAERKALSEAVADALVVTGNPDVVETLLKNFGAHISRDSMAKCMDYAKQVQRLRAPLIQRSEFTANDAARLMAYLPRELRQVIQTRFGTGSSANSNVNLHGNLHAATPANAKTLQYTIDEVLARYRETPPTAHEAETMATWLGDRGAINSTLLVQALRTRSAAFYVALMSRLLRLPMNLVQRCMNDRNGQLLAVLSRALGMDKAHFASSLMLVRANDNQPVEAATMDGAMQAFDRLSEARAQTMLRAWRDNPDLLRARI